MSMFIFKPAKYLYFSMNRLLNNSLDAKKPKRDPIQPQFNWRRASRYNPGAGALNKVDTTWLQANPDMNLYEDLKLQTKSEVVIEISKLLFDIPISARTRINNLENLLERLKLTPHDVIITPLPLLCLGDRIKH